MSTRRDTDAAEQFFKQAIGANEALRTGAEVTVTSRRPGEAADRIRQRFGGSVREVRMADASEAAATLEGGRLGEVSLTATETHETERFLDQLADIVTSHGQADGVGIAVPSVVDFATGCARFSVNVPLQDVPLRAVLSERRTLEAKVIPLASRSTSSIWRISSSRPKS